MQSWPAYLNQLLNLNDIATLLASAKPGLITAADYGLIKISGIDAAKLLQGQLTIDVEKLIEGQGQLAAHCQPQGRIISLFFIFKNKHDFYLFIPAAIIDNAIAALKKYAVFYKVTIDDISKQLSFVLAIHFKPDDEYISVALLPNVYLIISQSGEFNHTANYSANWHHILICNGITSLKTETIEKFLPHELNLPALNAVSFNKGCFTGQEIIARMQYRGVSKKTLCHAVINTKENIHLLADLYNDEAIVTGTLVDYALLGNAYSALVLLQNSLIDNQHYLAKKYPLTHITPLTLK